MRHFVRHDASELRFVGGGGDGSDVDEHRPARQCEGVDLFLGDDVELKRPGVLRWDGGYQFLAELPNVLRFGAVVRHDRHLLIDLGGRLETELALFVAGHVSITGIGELRTGRLWAGLDRQQQNNWPQQLSCKRTIHPGYPGLENVICHGVNLS